MESGMTPRITAIGLVLAIALLLAACATTEDQRRPDGTSATESDEPAEVEESAEAEAEDEEEDVRTVGVAERYGFDGQSFEEALEDEESLVGTRTIYFEFDSDTIREEFEEVLKAHAAFLGEHPEAELILEGHTDERGSREYNLGLGERRARAVLEVLEFNGADSSRIDVVSFGEERPAARGSGEEVWSLNRRVELLYMGVDR